MTPPVVFLDRLSAARPLNGVGYPYQIKADDLDKNFFAATLIIDNKLVEQTPETTTPRDGFGFLVGLRLGSWPTGAGRITFHSPLRPALEPPCWGRWTAC